MPRHARADKTFLAMALIGYEAERTKIDAAIREIQGQLGHRGPGRPAADGAVAPARRTLSVAARRRIAAAQRKRWAVLKASQAKAAAPKKRKLNAAGRKAIIEATRKRWAAVRAAKKTKPVGKAAAEKAATAAS